MNAKSVVCAMLFCGLGLLAEELSLDSMRAEYQRLAAVSRAAYQANELAMSQNKPGYYVEAERLYAARKAEFDAIAARMSPDTPEHMAAFLNCHDAHLYFIGVIHSRRRQEFPELARLHADYCQKYRTMAEMKQRLDKAAGKP